MARYIYDTRVARTRSTALKQALPGATVLYAMKANGHPAMVRAFAETCDGVDVASEGELSLALEAGARRLVLSGPGKTASFLGMGLQAGAIVNVESMTELYRIASLNMPASVNLRVNRAHALLPESTHAMTGKPTQFGIDDSSLGAAVTLAKSVPGLTLLGWHLHAVSGNMDVKAHNAFIADALEWSVSAAAWFGIELRQVNLGGGFGIDYQGSGVFDPGLLVIDPPSGVEVVVEPGRWLAAEAGWYEVEVVDLKRNHGRWFAIVRGGMHHFRHPVAHRDKYNHPFTVVPRDEWSHSWPRPVVNDVTIDVAGELCTPNDVLTRGQYVSRLRVGDVLRYAKAGAYGWEISPYQYLRHPSPEFVILS